MNVNEYRRQIGISKSKYVLDWIENGYLPGVKDPETGVIDIPSDMPRPYKSNGRTRKVSKLMEEIIKAADSQQSLYPQMFPLIREDTFTRTIESMIECRIISRQYSSTGAPFYELLPGWRNYNLVDKRNVLEVIGDGINRCASIVQIVQTVMLLLPML